MRKFCATTEVDAKKAHLSEFKAPYTFGEGLVRTLDSDSGHSHTDDIQFVSE